MIKCAFFKITILYGKNLVRRKGGKRENAQGLLKYSNILIQDDDGEEREWKRLWWVKKVLSRRQ